MDNDFCYVSSQIAAHCDEQETYCEICGSTMTQDIGDDFLECDNCEHKQFLEGQLWTYIIFHKIRNKQRSI